MNKKKQIRKSILICIISMLLFNVANGQKIVKASYYAHAFHGKTAANGKKYNMYEMTCAHKTLPFGTIIKVRNIKNNKVVYVEVTDRGPFVKNRVLDLSYSAAKKLDMIKSGVIKVEYTVVSEIPNEQSVVERIRIPALENIEKIIQRNSMCILNVKNKILLIDTLNLRTDYY